MSRRIPLTQGQFAIVDDADYEWLCNHKWHASKPRHIWYAVRTIGQKGKRRHIYMHRVILNPSAGFQSDHINGDGLDNRRCNLRLCTRSQNLMNARKWAKCSSKWKGVYWQKQAQKWAAQIKAKGKVCHLGLFDNEDEAGYAYNIAACMYFGEFALLNQFPVITKRYPYGQGGDEMEYCRDCASYRPHGEGLGTCFIWSTPFGGDSTPVCGSFVPSIPEERDTTSIAGKFAEALGCLEDAAHHLRDIDEQYLELYPDDECEEPELFFWQEIYETIDAGSYRKTPLERIQEKLEAVAKYVPKEPVEAS